MKNDYPLPALLSTPEGSKQFAQRVAQLTATSQRLWGTMEVHQMLAHCLIPLELALGIRQVKVNPLLALLGPITRPMFINPKPFRRNMPTDPGLIVRKHPDFEEKRLRLLQHIQQLEREGATAYSTAPHPLFGRLSPEQWDVLQTKHLDHHLRQFGV